MLCATTALLYRGNGCAHPPNNVPRKPWHTCCCLGCCSCAAAWRLRVWQHACPTVLGTSGTGPALQVAVPAAAACFKLKFIGTGACVAGVVVELVWLCQAVARMSVLTPIRSYARVNDMRGHRNNQDRDSCSIVQTHTSLRTTPGATATKKQPTKKFASKALGSNQQLTIVHPYLLLDPAELWTWHHHCKDSLISGRSSHPSLLHLWALSSGASCVVATYVGQLQQQQGSSSGTDSSQHGANQRPVGGCWRGEGWTGDAGTSRVQGPSPQVQPAG